jgi:hypothetical protein
MTTGTSYFVSKAAAVRYYTPYGYDNPREAVERKLAEGEIHIGKPEIKDGQRLLVVDEGTRYAIEDREHKWQVLGDETPFYFNCYRCGGRCLSHGDTRLADDGKRYVLPNGWTDLNGPAFQAYYCDPCKQAITG